MNKLHENETDLPAIGILGGGQLAKMISASAFPLGVNVVVCVKRDGDALPGVAGKLLVADWNVPAEALNFAQHVDIVTLENEFVNPESISAIENAGIPMVPSSKTIRLIQDKWLQKETLAKVNLPVVACRPVESVEEVADFAAQHAWPLVLKRRHEGYDGKGNATIRNTEEAISAWSKLSVNENGLYVEAFCPFEREIAVMVCRSVSGETATYPVVDTVQRDHICHTVRAPSGISPQLAQQARDIATAAVEAIDGYGVMGVEMFVTTDGSILINEMAPRVHNSGHYTIEACQCSQFENHMRAILGWPLGSTRMKAPAAVMVNLLGAGDGPARPAGLQNALRIDGARLHIYGKSKSVKGRKMGHVTATADSIAEAEQIAVAAASMLKFGGSASA